MKLTISYGHVLIFIYYCQSLLKCPVDALKTLGNSKQSPDCRSMPSPGGKLTQTSPSSVKKHSQVIKVGDIQAGLHRNDLAGLTKDEFIDLLSAAASDSAERSQNEDPAGVGSAAPGDSEDSGENELSKTCGIAMRAAEEAKAASQAQNSAGQQAAHEVKQQLAEKAQRAANAAQAALSEKQNEIHLLEDQMHDAETVMLEEHDSLNQTRQNVETAAKTVAGGREACSALEAALKLSRETLASAETLAVGAKHELNEKIKLMTAAKSKVSELERELERAKKEFINTRDSAIRASEAAKEAQKNANTNRK